MWGDRVVAPYPEQVQDKEYTKQEVYIPEHDIYITREGLVFREKNGIREQVRVRSNGLLTGSYTEEPIPIYKYFAENFIPNPLNLPYIRWRDYHHRATIKGMFWSNYPNAEAIRKEALHAEKWPKLHPEIFNPVIEIPETITLKSRI